MAIPRNSNGQYDTTVDRIEQAIARGETDERIAAREAVTVERVRQARRDMNSAVASVERRPRRKK